MIKRGLIALFSLLKILALAQEPHARYFTNRDALPTNTVYDILKDKNGFVWLGTEKGLFRFDGSKTLEMVMDKGQKKPLSNLVELPDHTILAQSFSGKVYETTHDFELKPLKKITTAKNYNPIFLFKNQLVYFKEDTVAFYDLKNDTHRFYSIQKPIAKNTLALNDSLVFSNQNGELFSYRNNQLKKITSSSFFKPYDAFYLNTPKGVLCVKKKNENGFELLINNQIKNIEGLGPNVFVQNLVYENGLYWICSSEGVYAMDANFNFLNHKQPFFKEANVSKVIALSKNELLISTLNKGLIYIPNWEVKSFFNADEKITRLNNCHNQIIAGTNKSNVFLFDKFNSTLIGSTDFKNEVSACAYNARAGQLAFSSGSFSILNNKKIINETALSVKSIREINPYVYLVGYSVGVGFYILPNTPDKFLPRGVDKQKIKNSIYPFSNSTARCRSVEYSFKDSISFYSTTEGLFYFKNNQNSEIKFNNQPLVSVDLALINNKLWIAGPEFGLLVYDISTQNVRQIINPEPERGPILKLAHNQNNIYLMFEKNMATFSLAQNKITSLQTLGFTLTGEIKDVTATDSILAIATTNELIIAPQHYLQPPKETRLSINKVKNNGIVVSAKAIETPYNKIDAEFDFSVLNLSNASEFNIRYKLKPTDEWSYLPNGQTSVFFNSLASDEYRIEFEAINAQSGKVSNKIVFPVIVTPPFYQTTSFYALCLVGFSATGYILYRIRLKNILKKQNEILEKEKLAHQLDLSTLKTLRAQMNPHFIFNALNSIQSFIYSGDKEQASKYLSLFSELSRSLLNSASHTEISLHDELRLIQLYIELEQIRTPKVKFELQVSPEIDLHNTFIPAMILQPLVENAFKHAFTGIEDNCLITLKINQIEFENKIVIELEDNGIGRKNSALNKLEKGHKSFATDSIENRISLLNKNSPRKIEQTIIDLTDKDLNPQGTKVVLTIPLNLFNSL